MNILLVNANTYRQMPLPPVPIGLTYVSNALKQAGHKVTVLDCMFSGDPPNELRAALRECQASVVGFSLRNLDSQSMTRPRSFVPDFSDLVAAAREEDVVSVLGGTAFSTLPQDMLRRTGADYGIAGQGEVSFVSLLDSIAKGGLDTTIPGLVWRQDGEIRANAPSITGYRALAADWDAVDLRAYTRKMFGVGIVVRTGCQFHCSYCDSPTLFGKIPIARDAKEIVEEMRGLVRSRGIREFFLVDPCFNTTSTAKDVLEEIIRADLRVTFCTEMVPATGTYDDELFRLHKRAGGLFFLMGGDSLSATMLENYRKPCDLDDIHACADLADKHGVRFGQSLLFGGPGENERTLKETLGRVARIPFSVPLAEIGIRIMPNTELFETARREGVVGSASELLDAKFYVSRDLDLTWARKAIRETLHRYSYRRLKMLPVAFKSFLSRHRA
ncbi:MAG: hypothetical protein A3F92_00240 [Candidatus Rokubacteria bacterium RIFCSPLOWO2_12_FULL_71_22]|nr:MAG: hypothetical protein A3F92_00240 [Candidatus Rokubacteria bacterium RIFCSPLOWO2_12_FULL_71_22]